MTKVRLADIDPGSYSRPCIHGNRLASCGMCVVDPQPRPAQATPEEVLTLSNSQLLALMTDEDRRERGDGTHSKRDGVA